MTTWTSVTQTATSYTSPIATDGYVVSGYVVSEYIDGTEQWSSVTAQATTWTVAQ